MRYAHAMTTIAAQMYTLRDHCETPSDIAASCKKLKALGFDAIQASAAGFGSIAAAELKTILDDLGMTCVATHKGFDFFKDVEACVEYHQTLGCPLTAVGGFGFGGASEAEWKAYAQEFNEISQKYVGKPVRIGYHNHSHELSPFGLEEHPESIKPDHSPMSLLLDTLAEPAWFEIDVYWIAHGGADPAEYLRRCKGRVPAIHAKDMTVTAKREHKMCEVGAGNLNWPAIIEAAKDAGVEYYIIERDSGDLDPFDSLKISLDNLKAMGVG